MKTVQPGFLAMGAGSGRSEAERKSGKEDALTLRRMRARSRERQAWRLAGEASAREGGGWLRRRGRSVFRRDPPALWGYWSAADGCDGCCSWG
nr:unnamed protein product [Digitaria exilis]